ncbi:hypothetical protein WJX72_007353 [[Myrmecia] bisecta]|uniref:SHSP domain-containing protein n=1 Tax=[Myrmecia] bisecta TaxID=41462 RepID=A0AAW1PM02_9CHLO
MSTTLDRRLGVLGGHFALVPSTACLERLDCAATQATLFARPAAVDMPYTRPAAPLARDQRVEEAALRHASRILDHIEDRASFDIPAHIANAMPAGPPASASAPAEPPSFARPAAVDPVKDLVVASPDVTPAQYFQTHITSGWSPQVDAVETPFGYSLDVALPGVRAEHLRVELRARELTISGKRTRGASEAEGLRGVRISRGPARVIRGHLFGSGLVLRREVAQGPFTCRWTLPDDADTGSLRAEFSNGMLHIKLRKHT